MTKPRKSLPEDYVVPYRDFSNEERLMGKCTCGRSPTGLCVGWHRLKKEEYKEKKKEYDKLEEEKKKKAFHTRAIDGFGE